MFTRKNIWIMDHGVETFVWFMSQEELTTERVRRKERNIRKARHNCTASNREGVNAYWMGATGFAFVRCQSDTEKRDMKIHRRKITNGKTMCRVYHYVFAFHWIDRSKNQEENPPNKRTTFFWIFKLRHFAPLLKEPNPPVSDVSPENRFSLRVVLNIAESYRMLWLQMNFSCTYIGVLGQCTALLLLLLLLYK